MTELRLGDVIDDHCIKCRRLTNHSIVSIIDGKAAKVRCRTCYHDHDYRNEQAPPSKKDLKKMELFKEVLASSGAPSSTDEETELAVVDMAEEVDTAEEVETAEEADTIEEPVAVAEPVKEPAPAKKTRGRAKRA